MLGGHNLLFFVSDSRGLLFITAAADSIRQMMSMWSPIQGQLEPEQPTLIFTERHPQLSVFSFIRDCDDDGGGDQNIHPLSSF